MPFAQILGQDRAVGQLRRAWADGRLPQAYCFTGPVGVGKRTAALALAQAVNCLAAGPSAGNPATADACGACIACRKIAAGIHPDVVEVRPEAKTVITIDQIREVTARANLRAYEGRTKVWILDPADLMQEPAANALLKTLEEPAGASLFLLVTAVPSVLLPTILSRCQEVRFGPLGEAYLREILTQHGRSPEQAAAAAALAAGSAERAVALDVDQARATRDRVLQEVWDSLDSLPALLERAERLSKDRTRFETGLEILTSHTRDLAVARICGEAGGYVHADRRSDLLGFASRHPVGTYLRIFQAQTEAQWALAHHANSRLTAERMLLRMREAIGAGQEIAHARRGSRGI